MTGLTLAIMFAVYAFAGVLLHAVRAFSSRAPGPVAGNLVLGAVDIAAGVAVRPSVAWNHRMPGAHRQLTAALANASGERRSWLTAASSTVYPVSLRDGPGPGRRGPAGAPRRVFGQHAHRDGDDHHDPEYCRVAEPGDGEACTRRRAGPDRV
jgi:hypothetical protein